MDNDFAAPNIKGKSDHGPQSLIRFHKPTTRLAWSNFPGPTFSLERKKLDQQKLDQTVLRDESDVRLVQQWICCKSYKVIYCR